MVIVSIVFEFWSCAESSEVCKNAEAMICIFILFILIAMFVVVIISEYRFNKVIKAHDKRMRQMFSDIEEACK